MGAAVAAALGAAAGSAPFVSRFIPRTNSNPTTPSITMRASGTRTRNPVPRKEDTGWFDSEESWLMWGEKSLVSGDVNANAAPGDYDSPERRDTREANSPGEDHFTALAEGREQEPPTVFPAEGVETDGVGAFPHRIEPVGIVDHPDDRGNESGDVALE